MANWKKRQPVFEICEYDDITTKLVKINGIVNIQEFLSPNSSSIHNPYLLLNIEPLTERIIKAIKYSEKIVIFSDP